YDSAYEIYEKVIELCRKLILQLRNKYNVDKKFLDKWEMGYFLKFEDYNKAIKLTRLEVLRLGNPYYEKAYILLARILMMRNEQQSAKIICHTVLSLFPD